MQGKTGLLIGLPILCLVLGGLAWWNSPGNVANRYRRMSTPDLKQTLNLNPNDALASRILALRLAHEGNMETAEPILRSAIALNPNDPEVAAALGKLLMSHGQSTEAFQILKSVASRFPNYTPGRAALGAFYLSTLAYVHASTEYEAVVAQDKTSADAWYQLARCYQQRMQTAKALNAIDMALRLYPDQPDYLLFKGTIDVTVGNVSAGMEETRRAAQLAPQNLVIDATLTHLLLTQHRSAADLDLAEQTLRQWEQLKPDDPRLPFQRGELERLRQHWLPAAQSLEKALVTTPRQDEVYYSLSQVYRRLNRAKEADKMLNIFQQRQALEQQVRALHNAIGSRPNDPDLYAQLADIQLRLGDIDGARVNIRAGLAIDPANAHLLMELRQLGLQSATEKGAQP